MTSPSEVSGAPPATWGSPARSSRATVALALPGGRVDPCRVRGALEELRDAPVHHDHLAELADHHVLRLEVAMDDAPRVREGDRLADPREQAQRLGEREARPRERIDPGAAHPLHHVEGASVAEGPGVVDGDDAGVLEPRQDRRFALEAPLRAARREAVPQHLDRDVASERRVLRGVDDPHPAAIDLALQPVAGPGEVGTLGQGREPRQGTVRDPGHGSTPSTARASARNSSSEAVTSRRVSSTRTRKRRRAAERSFVILVSVTPSVAASSR